MLVGWGGNNGSTVTAGCLANNSKAPPHRLTDSPALAAQGLPVLLRCYICLFLGIRLALCCEEVSWLQQHHSHDTVGLQGANSLTHAATCRVGNYMGLHPYKVFPWLCTELL